MEDVRGLFLGMPHGTTPAAVTTNRNIIMSSFKSSGNIQKKESGPYRGFAYWMLISDPIHLAKTARANFWNLMELLQDSRRKDWFNQSETKHYKFV